MPDSLGDRMKGHYENRTRFMLPRRTYTLIRVDGKAFHTFTRGCDRPWDRYIAWSMDQAAHGLCKETQGVCFAYLQSDEISLLLTDFATEQTCAWFDGNLQKTASVAASIATAHFNRFWQSLDASHDHLAYFDARVWTIPDPTEVENYFIWRQQDATRNSIQMLGRTYFSHKEMEGLSNEQVQERLWTEHNVNWNDTPTKWKRGWAFSPAIGHASEGRWIAEDELPIFTSDEGRQWLRRRIPRYE